MPPNLWYVRTWVPVHTVRQGQSGTSSSITGPLSLERAGFQLGYLASKPQVFSGLHCKSPFLLSRLPSPAALNLWVTAPLGGLDDPFTEVT